MLEIMKQLALDAVDKESLADYTIGTVKNVSPLIISQEDGPELTERFLLLSRNVVDHEERGSVRIWTDQEPDHWSEYRFIRENGLKEGEKVILMKASGGQQYVVLDRVAKGGEG